MKINSFDPKSRPFDLRSIVAWIGLGVSVTVFAIAVALFYAATVRADDRVATARASEGQLYRTLPEPDAYRPRGDRIEVVEFFWYGCPHCYTFEPHLALWNREKSQVVELKRIPAVWHPSVKLHARLFYTLEALGRSDLHHEVFDAIHVDGHTLLGTTETETENLQTEFAMKHGIAKEAFTRAYHAANIDIQLKEALDLAKKYRIEMVPTLVVNRRYVVEAKTGSHETDIIEGLNSAVDRISQDSRAAVEKH